MTENNGIKAGQVVFLAAITAALASVGTTYAMHAFGLGPVTTVAPVHETTEPTVTRGVGLIEVPDLVTLDRSAASGLATSAGLEFLVTGEEASDSPAGRVIRQEPLAESNVQSGTAVQVVISSGPPMVEIPEVAERPLVEVRAELEELGLVVEADETSSADQAPGTVVSARPSAGDEVEAGSEVFLIATPAGIEVPDLSGERRYSASQLLEEAGLELGRVRRRYDERRPELIVTLQEPEAGAIVPAGTSVDITIND